MRGRAAILGALLLAGLDARAEGLAAPADTAAATAGTPAASPVRPVLFGQVFAGYGAHRTAGERTNAFDLNRAEGGFGFEHDEGYAALLNLEAIRSAGPQSLFGVDNDSLVLRVKHAFGQAAPRTGPVFWQLRAGLVPDVWVESVQSRYDLRGLLPLLSEAAGFFEASDLGASAKATALEGALEARLALTNGEGRNQRELNPGKNLTAALVFDSLRLTAFRQSSVALQVGWRDGSVGPSSQADRRWMAAVTGRHRLWFAGGEAVWAQGYQGRGEVNADGVSLWLNGPVWGEWLGVALAGQRWRPDADAEGAKQRAVAGVYADLWTAPEGERPVLGFPRFRISIYYEDMRADGAAATLLGAPEASTVQSLWISLTAQASAHL